MIAERVRAVARENPGRLAIVDGDVRITYGELVQRIDYARTALHRRLQIEPGDVILATLENSWQFVAFFLGVCELGGIFMPCHSDSRALELQKLYARVRARGAVSGPRSLPEWGIDRCWRPADSRRGGSARIAALRANSKRGRAQRRALSGDIRFHR